MATNSFVELDLPEAVDLADFTGIQHDLRGAKDFANKLLEMISADKPDYSLAEPLSIAILIMYCRSFVTGVRKRLKEEALEQLSDDQLKAHDFFCAIRDKHIAHSVNCFEESVPRARFWVERVKTEGITSISCCHHRVVGLSQNDLSVVVELADVLLCFVGKKIKEEQARLLPIVRALPLEDVLRGGTGPVTSGMGPVEKRRRR